MLRKQLWTVELLMGANWITLSVEMTREDARETRANYPANQYLKTRIVKFTRDAK